MAATPVPASPSSSGNDKSELEHQLDAMDHHQPHGILTMKLHTDSDSDDELHGRVDINRHLLDWDPLMSPASTPGSNNPTPKGHYRDRSQTTAGTGAFGRPQLGGSITAPSTPVGAQRSGIPSFGSPVRPAGGLVSQHLGAFAAREAAANTSQMLPKGINVQPRPPSSTVAATPPSRGHGAHGHHTPPQAPNTTTNASAVTAGKTTSDLAPPPGATERKRRYSAPKADIGGLLGFWKTQEKKKEPVAAATAAAASAAAPPTIARQGSSGKSSTPSKWQLQQKEREEKEKEQKEAQAKAQAEADRKRREAAASVSAKMAAAAAKKPHDPSLPTGNATVVIAVTAPSKRADELAAAAKKKKEEDDRIEAARKAERDEKLRKQKAEDDARVAKEAADREERARVEAERRAAEEKAEQARKDEAERIRLANEQKAKEAAEAALAAEQRRIAAEAEEKRRRDEQEARERELAAHLAELKRLEAEKADEAEKARLRAEQVEREAAAAAARELEQKAIAAAATERERLRVEAEETKKREAEAVARAKQLAEEESKRAEKARQEAETQRLENERLERVKHEEETKLAAERAAQKQKEEDEELAHQRERERVAESFEDAALAVSMEAPPSPMTPPATPGTFVPTGFALDGHNGDPASPSSAYTAPAPGSDSLAALNALPTVRMIGRTSVGGRERSASSGGLPLPLPSLLHSSPDTRVTRESIAAANATDAPGGARPTLDRGPSTTISVTPVAPLTPEEEEKAKKKAEADAVQRVKVRAEITSTEQTYVKSLGILVDQFIHPLKSSDAYDVSQKDVSLMFSNVELLYNFHRVFLKEITVVESVGDVLLKYADFLKMYTQYLNGYPRSLQCINDNRNNKKFQAFLAEKRKACGLDLMSYLIMPVQRIPRYELLLREMKRLTPSSHHEYVRLCEAFEKIQHIGSHINEEQRQVENMSKLLEIQNRISGEFGTLMQPHRRLVREGQLTKLSPGLVTSTNARLLFLFSDIVVYTTTSHKFRGHCELAKSTIIEHSDKKKHGFELKYGDKTMIWLCQSEKEKTDWMGEIIGAMNAIKEGIEQQMKRRQASRQNKAKGSRGRVDVAHMRQARSHSLLAPEEQASGPGTGLSAPASPSAAASSLGSTPMSFSSSPSLVGSPLSGSGASGL